jgi:NADPH:quinone reductase-like Zn-dependent oxidoreductase
LGFNLNDWLESNTGEDIQSIAKKIQHLFIKGELKTSVQGSFSLDQAVAGLRTYIKTMSAGKIIFTP